MANDLKNLSSSLEGCQEEINKKIIVEGLAEALVGTFRQIGEIEERFEAIHIIPISIVACLEELRGVVMQLLEQDDEQLSRALLRKNNEDYLQGNIYLKIAARRGL
ncbi:MAG: hypothetical protein ACE5OZ_20035 [Candidatus Heimdallarchaeota archaeon]